MSKQSSKKNNIRIKDHVLAYETKVPNWYYHTSTKSYADFFLLNKLKEASVNWEMETIEGETYTIYKDFTENKIDVIAFFIEHRLAERNTQKYVLPTIWPDNYFSLFLSKKREISVKVKTMDVAKKN